MTPQSLTVSGFLPFAGEVSIDFTNNPYAMVTGSNGTGKSSLIIDGIVYSLYGESRQKPQWLINNACDRSDVSFQYRHRGDDCCIRRVTERDRTTKITFTVGEADLSERTTTATQAKIEQFLGFSKKLLLTTCIAGQEDAGLFSAMGPAEREKTLVQLLALEIWSDKRKRTTEWLAAVKNDRERVKEIKEDITELENVLLSLYTQRDDLKPIIQDYQEKHNKISYEESHFIHGAALYDEAARVRDHIQEIQEKMDELQRWVESMRKIGTPSEIEEKINMLSANIRDTQSQLKRCENEERIAHERYTKAKEFESYLHAYQEHDINAGVLERVPCVGMDIHDSCELLDHAKQSANILFVLLEKHGKNNLEELVEESKEEVQKAKDYQERVLIVHQDTDNTLKNIWGDRSQLNREYETANKKQEVQKHILQYKKELEDLLNRLKDLPEGEMKGLHAITNEKNELQSLLDTHRKDLAEIEGEIKWREGKILQCENTLNEMDAAIQEWSFYEALQEAYKNIPTSLLYDTVPLIEEYANEILRSITADHQVNLRVHKETKVGSHTRALDLVSVSPRGSLPFDALSGSERFRQSLALRIALSRVIAETYESPMNFFIMDEGFGCLDQVNTSIIKDTLRGVAKRFEMFYVISHVEDLKDTFDTEVVISRESPQLSIVEHDTLNEVVLDR
jgi:DNA repair exonuclease SbcCD ATPase subunit